MLGTADGGIHGEVIPANVLRISIKKYNHLSFTTFKLHVGEVVNGARIILDTVGYEVAPELAVVTDAGSVERMAAEDDYL